MLSLPVIIIVSRVLTIISPVIRVIPSVESCCWAPLCQPSGSATVGKGDYTLRFGKTKGVGVRAVFMSVVASLAVMAIPACWAVPNSVGGVELSAKATAVREWERASGTAGQCLVVVVLGHGEPLEAMIASVFYSCG